MAQWKVLSGSECDWSRLASLPGATVFHSLRWSRVLERGFNGSVLVLALQDESGALLAAWPGCLMTLGPVRILYGVFPKGNFVGSAETIAANLPGFQAACRERGVHFLRMIACEDDPVRDLPGGRCGRHVRHVLDLAGKTPEGLWEGYKKRVRRDVRVAEKAGLTVRPMRREEFPKFHQMLGEVHMRNAAATGIGPPFYEAIWDELAGDGTADFLVADQAGEPVAATVGIHDRGVTYYFAAFSRTDAMRLCPNDLLLHTLITRAIGRGARQFDLLSSGAHDEGLIRFKEKWGAEQRPFDLVECWFSSWRRWAWDAAMYAAQFRAGAAVLRLVRRMMEGRKA